MFIFLLCIGLVILSFLTNTMSPYKILQKDTPSCRSGCATYKCSDGSCIADPQGPYTDNTCGGKCTPIYHDRKWINDNITNKSIEWTQLLWKCDGKKPLVYTNDNGQEVNLPLCPQINSGTPSPDGPGCYYPLGYTPSGWNNNKMTKDNNCDTDVCSQIPGNDYYGSSGNGNTQGTCSGTYSPGGGVIKSCSDFTAKKLCFSGPNSNCEWSDNPVGLVPHCMSDDNKYGNCICAKTQ